MSELATAVADSSLSNADLISLLETLDDRQVVLSMQRRQLHDRIDRLLRENGDTSEIAALQEEERTISSSRLHLHQRITDLRIERGRRVAGIRANPHE